MGQWDCVSVQTVRGPDITFVLLHPALLAAVNSPRSLLVQNESTQLRFDSAAESVLACRTVVLLTRYEQLDLSCHCSTVNRWEGLSPTEDLGWSEQTSSWVEQGDS